jgi:hypothetical protein
MSIFVPETPSKVKYWRSVVNNRHYLQLKENEKRVEGVKYINIYEANGNKFTWVRKDTLVAITPE